MSQTSNSCFTSIFWPAQTFDLVFFPAFGFYGSVKLHELVPLHIFPMFPICFLSTVIISGFLYPLAGKMFSLSQNFIFYAENKMNSADKSGHGRRVVRSLRPFGSKIGSVKIIKRTFLFVILWISNLAINAILLH